MLAEVIMELKNWFRQAQLDTSLQDAMVQLLALKGFGRSGPRGFNGLIANSKQSHHQR